MVFDTTGSIATYIATRWVLPTGVSGTLNSTVSLNRIKVQNFVDVSIAANAIPEAYQSIITDFASADALEAAFAWSSSVATSGGTVIIESGATARDGRKLGDMEIKSEGKAQTAALNYLSTLSKDTPTKLRETARTTMEDLGRPTFFFKANG